MDLFSICSYCPEWICSFCVQLAVVVITVLFGALIAWKPRKVIEAQTVFYRPFNWRLEPISMEKEIRNTRIMGFALILLGIVALALALSIR